MATKKLLCANCKVECTTYCVDCGKSLCRFCTVLLHHPDTKNEKHSLEEIASYQGVKIITPILLDLFLIGAAGFMLSGQGIGPEYFNGNSYCPALSRGRRFIAHFDANFFFYHKAHLAVYCDWEDSYWRFFIDTWVRAILTNTDSWLLLLSEGIKALIFEEFFRVLLTPIIAFAYALVAAFFVYIEWEIFKIIYEGVEGEEHRFTNLFLKVENCVQKISFASKLVITDKKKPPPLTLYRKRPFEDWLELIRYFYNRQTRMLRFYRAQAHSACSFLLWGSMTAALLIRVVCMLFGNSGILAGLRLLGGSDWGSAYIQWFGESTGMNKEDIAHGGYSDTRYSDFVVSTGMSAALAQLPLIGNVGEDVGNSFLGIFVAFKPLFKRLIIPASILLPPLAIFRWKIKRQRKQFADDWKPKTRKDMWGDMSREQPAKGWDKLCFSNRPMANKAM